MFNFKKTQTATAAKGLGAILALFIQAENLNALQASANHSAYVNAEGVIEFATDISVASRLLGAQLQGHIPEYVDLTKPYVYLEHHNAYVNSGLNNSLDRESGAGGTTIGFIGVSSNTTAVTATTAFLNGASGGTAANTIIKPCTNSRSAQTTTYTVTSAFVNADFTSGVFVWNKVGLLNTPTDAGTGLIDVIGGTGGSSPYNKTFSMDLTAVGAFSVILAIAVTAVAV